MTSGNDPQNTLDALASLGGIATLGAVCRTILSESSRTALGFCRALACGCFVAYLVGGLLESTALATGWRNIIIGASAFVADYILMLLLTLATVATAHPGSALDWVISFLTGLRSSGSKTDFEDACTPHQIDHAHPHSDKTSHFNHPTQQHPDN